MTSMASMMLTTPKAISVASPGSFASPGPLAINFSYLSLFTFKVAGATASGHLEYVITKTNGCTAYHTQNTVTALHDWCSCKVCNRVPWRALVKITTSELQCLATRVYQDCPHAQLQDRGECGELGNLDTGNDVNSGAPPATTGACGSICHSQLTITG